MLHMEVALFLVLRKTQLDDAIKPRGAYKVEYTAEDLNITQLQDYIRGKQPRVQGEANAGRMALTEEDVGRISAAASDFGVVGFQNTHCNFIIRLSISTKGGPVYVVANRSYPGKTNVVGL